jgi:hypothetical protein
VFHYSSLHSTLVNKPTPHIPGLASYNINVEVNSERILAAPWGWHCFAETCSSIRVNKEEYNLVHFWSIFTNLCKLHHNENKIKFTSLQRIMLNQLYYTVSKESNITGRHSGDFKCIRSIKISYEDILNNLTLYTYAYKHLNAVCCVDRATYTRSVSVVQ